MRALTEVLGRISDAVRTAWTYAYLIKLEEALAWFLRMWSKLAGLYTTGAVKAITIAGRARGYATAAQDVSRRVVTFVVNCATGLLRLVQTVFQAMKLVVLWLCHLPGWASETIDQTLLGIQRMLHLTWVIVCVSFQICAAAAVFYITWRVILRPVIHFSLLKMEEKRERARHSQERARLERAQQERVRGEQARREKAKQKRTARASREQGRNACEEQIRPERRRAYERWRTACDELFKCPQIATSIPQPRSWPCEEPGCVAEERVLEACQHNLRELFRSTNDLSAALKFEQIRWSPNARRIAELENAGVSQAVVFANEISGVINMILDERRK